MKNILIALIISLPLSAFGAQPTNLNNLSDFYYELTSQEVDLVDHGFFISFMSASASSDELKASGACSSARSFKKTTAKEVTKLVRQDLSQAIELIFDGTDGFFEWMTKMETIMSTLESELTGKKIATCVDESTPAYSDGHLVTYVKVGGRIEFAFESGQPD